MFPKIPLRVRPDADPTSDARLLFGQALSIADAMLRCGGSDPKDGAPPPDRYVRHAASALVNLALCCAHGGRLEHEPGPGGLPAESPTADATLPLAIDPTIAGDAASLFRLALARAARTIATGDLGPLDRPPRRGLVGCVDRAAVTLAHLARRAQIGPDARRSWFVSRPGFGARVGWRCSTTWASVYVTRYGAAWEDLPRAGASLVDNLREVFRRPAYRRLRIQPDNILELVALLSCRCSEPLLGSRLAALRDGSFVAVSDLTPDGVVGNEVRLRCDVALLAAEILRAEVWPLAERWLAAASSPATAEGRA